MLSLGEKREKGAQALPSSAVGKTARGGGGVVGGCAWTCTGNLIVHDGEEKPRAGGIRTLYGDRGSAALCYDASFDEVVWEMFPAPCLLFDHQGG